MLRKRFVGLSRHGVILQHEVSHASATFADLVRALTFTSLMLGTIWCTGCGENAAPPIAATPVPTSVPPPTIWPADPTLWHGTWTPDGATPLGDCLVDRLHLSEPWTNMTIAIARTGESVAMDFWAGYEKDGGYTPDVFVGTIDEARRIEAHPQDTTSVYKTWLFGSECHKEGWTISSGHLSGVISADGRSLTGSIVESFRTLSQEQIFTIESHFTAEVPQ